MSLIPENDVAYANMLFDRIYQGDKALCGVAMTVLEAVHLWDDLIDGDPVDHRDVNQVFLKLFTVLAPHPLWDRELSGLMYSVYLRWQEANTFECDPEATDHELSQAWMLRAGVYDIFVLLAAKRFGTEWAEAIGPEVRRAYGEQLNSFIEETRSCQHGPQQSQQPLV